MSSVDEGSVQAEGIALEHRRWAGVSPAGPGAPRSMGLGLDLGPL